MYPKEQHEMRGKETVLPQEMKRSGREWRCSDDIMVSLSAMLTLEASSVSMTAGQC